MESIKSVLGPAQIKMKERSEADAMCEEIEAHRANHDLEYYSCNIEGRKHPPYPMIKGTYG